MSTAYRNSRTSRADVIGSLLRPQYLLDAREQLERGELTPAAFKAIEDRAVDEAVALAGGGRARRGHRRRDAPLCVLRSSRRSARRLRQVRRLVDHVPRRRGTAGQSPAAGGGRQAEVAAADGGRGVHLSARPDQGHAEGDAAQRAAGGGLLRPRAFEGAYPTRDAYLADLVDFTRREIEELRRLGCEYVQIDAPQYAALLDEKIREGYRQRGNDPDKMLDANIELDNAIIDGHPGMTFGIHICRGNHKSMFYASGGYDRIAAQVFHAHAVRSLPARVRRRAIGDVRAAEARPRRSRRRARADQLEGAAARSRKRRSRRGSRKRRRSSRSSGSRSARSAASRRPTKATGCPRTISGRSSSWWGGRQPTAAGTDRVSWLACDHWTHSIDRRARCDPAHRAAARDVAGPSRRCSIRPTSRPCCGRRRSR